MPHPVVFESVAVRYPGAARPAVDALDLVVEAGERVALVGPSGAGKSTLIALANGLVLPSRGSVHTFGVDTRSLARRRHRQVRRRIGTVHQDHALVGPLRVAHNVAAGRLGSWGRLRAMASLLRPFDVPEIAEALDRVGIADKLWERADQLSGGQQQRVAIARVLFQQPTLVLADEPVSSLDPARSKSIMDVLVDLVEGGRDRPGTQVHSSEGDLVGGKSVGPTRSLVASLHDAGLALSHCDRIVGLRGGRMFFDRPAGSVTDEMLADLYAFEGAADGDGDGDPG